jgi:hypothetical protein
MTRAEASRAAVRLSQRTLRRPRRRFTRARDGRIALRRRAHVRALCLRLRPVSIAALILSVIVLTAGDSAGAGPVVIAFALVALVADRGAAPPKRTRAARIVRDVRPLLLKPLIEILQPMRAGRILRAQSEFELPPLPPDRPRTRISERRPGPVEGTYD